MSCMIGTGVVPSAACVTLTCQTCNNRLVFLAPAHLKILDSVHISLACTVAKAPATSTPFAPGGPLSCVEKAPSPAESARQIVSPRPCLTTRHVTGTRTIA